MTESSQLDRGPGAVRAQLDKLIQAAPWKPQGILRQPGNTNYRLRDEALDEIARLGPACTPFLLEELEQLPAIRNNAGDLGYPLTNALIAALGLVQDRESVDPLIRLLDHSNAHIRCSVVRSLGVLGAGRDEQPANEWRPLPETGRSGAAGDARIVRALSTAMLDDDESVRKAAARGLGQMVGASGVAEFLVTSLADDRPEVRLAACWAFGSSSATDGEGLLTDLMGDPDNRVRDAALDALAQAGDPSVIPELLRRLKEPTQRCDSCKVIVRSAGKLATNYRQHVLPDLMGLLDEDNFYVRNPACHAIEAITTEASLFASALGNPNHDVQVWAAKHLREINWRPADPEAEALWQEILRREDAPTYGGWNPDPDRPIY